MEKEIKPSALQTFKKYKPLLHELVTRDLKVKYRRSFLGYLWSLLNPIMMMAIMSFVFSYMFRNDIPNYPIYLICGQTLWAFFNESTTMAMSSVINNGTLIRKVYIPKFIFPMSRVFSSFVTMSFSLVAILIVIIFTGVKITPTILLFPVPLFFLLVFSMGVGMVLSALSVYFRDIMHLYGVLTMGWMYLTPIFYPLSALPKEVIPFILANPMYYFITFFRDVVVYGTIPSLNVWLFCAGSAVFSITVGLLIFRKLQKNFILYV